jgi:hypothetical protein
MFYELCSNTKSIILTDFDEGLTNNDRTPKLLQQTARQKKFLWLIALFFLRVYKELFQQLLIHPNLTPKKVINIYYAGVGSCYPLKQG